MTTIQSEEFWSELQSRVRRFIRSRVADQHLAEDLAQDTMLRVFRKLSTLKQAERLSSWALTIARHNIADAYRGRQALTRTLESLDAEPAEELAKGLVDDAMLASVLKSLLSTLPDHYRQAVQRCDIEGLSQKQLADELGLSVSAVKSRVQRGRALMKKHFMDCCELEMDHRGQVMDYHCHNPQSCLFQDLPAGQKCQVR